MASIATLRDLTEALIESAGEEEKLNKVISDMEDFFSILDANDELRNILWSSTDFNTKAQESVRQVKGGSRYGF
jgi:F0F1-type ATP synthase delta subunit